MLKYSAKASFAFADCSDNGPFVDSRVSPNMNLNGTSAAVSGSMAGVEVHAVIEHFALSLELARPLW
jgi:hypothetical protein